MRVSGQSSGTTPNKKNVVKYENQNQVIAVNRTAPAIMKVIAGLLLVASPVPSEFDPVVDVLVSGLLVV